MSLTAFEKRFTIFIDKIFTKEKFQKIVKTGNGDVISKYIKDQASKMVMKEAETESMKSKISKASKKNKKDKKFTTDVRHLLFFVHLIVNCIRISKRYLLQKYPKTSRGRGMNLGRQSISSYFTLILLDLAPLWNKLKSIKICLILKLSEVNSKSSVFGRLWNEGRI